MKEFWITVTYTVDAHDHDEAVEIAKAVRKDIEGGALLGHGYRVRDVETQTIEETG